MKKILILFCFLNAISCSVVVCAQEWELVQPGKKTYFTNSIGYLRGMRIDSVAQQGDSVIYYPFKTARLAYMDWYAEADLNGGSWWGKEIVSFQGITTIANQLGKPVIIRTLAEPGDTWTFFGDEQGMHYEAEITGADTQTVKGMPDSVKTIRLSCLDGAGNIVADSVNGMELVLSKYNGLVSALDFYLFPYRDTTGTYNEDDCYYYESGWDGYNGLYGGGTPGLLRYNLVDFHPPDADGVYNFQPGDALSIWETTYSWGGVSDSRVTERVITGQTITDSTIVYTCTCAGPPLIYVERGLLADTIHMPEEWHEDSYYCFYQPDDTSYCVKSDRWLYRGDKIINGRYGGGGPEPAFRQVGYKDGVGETFYHSGGSTINTAVVRRSLEAAKKNGLYCWWNNSYMLGIGDPDRVGSPVNMQIYPNPANGTFRVDAGSSGIASLQVFDLAGKLLLTRAFTGKNTSESVDIHGLTPGIYLLKVYAGNLAGYTKLIVR